MPLQIKREGATPNLLKYSVIADEEGGEVVLSRDDLIRDCVKGPLRMYIERGTRPADDAAAGQYLICNPAMRVFVTPRSFERVAVNGAAAGGGAALKIMAEPNAVAVVALEFRHTLAA